MSCPDMGQILTSTVSLEKINIFSRSSNHYIGNNLSESFSAWVLESRYFPCKDLVDKIRIKMMENMNQRRKLASGWKGVLVPLSGRHVRRSDDRVGKVDCMEKREVHDIVDKTCTCRRRQLGGLPCRHAYEVIVGPKAHHSNFNDD